MPTSSTVMTFRPAFRAGILITLAVLCGFGAQSGRALLQSGRELQASGASEKALQAYKESLTQSRAQEDRAGIAAALAGLASLEVSLGSYKAAIEHGSEAAGLFQRLGDAKSRGAAINSVGLAYLYSADYGSAFAQFQNAITANREARDDAAEIISWNNLGNVEYFRGRYQDAFRAYERAMALAGHGGNQPWSARGRRLSLANLGTLYLRLGRNEKALEVYSDLRQSAGAFTPSEEARLLLNLGVAYRRLGSPVKSLEVYRRARALFERDKHVNGELSVLRNIGIVLALDLGKLRDAEQVFTTALATAAATGNRRESAQLLLYRAEVRRRIGDARKASRDFQSALDEAASIGAAEEKWKALYGLGRVALDRGEAAHRFAEAIQVIESVRMRIGARPLRAEFLADKRDVYDAAIATAVREPGATAERIFSLVERSRARTSQDASGPADLAQVRSALPAGTAALAYWMGDSEMAIVWARRDAAGFTHRTLPAAFDETAARFLQSISKNPAEWRKAGEDVARVLLPRETHAVLSDIKHLIVIPDGIATAIPFEALAPDGRELLLERFRISYAPSGAVLLRRPTRSRMYWPWESFVVTFGNPSLGGETVLPGSADEIRAIESIIPGRVDVHSGSANQKRAFLERTARPAPIFHISTHSVADMDDSDRSRILFSSSGPGESNELYRQEIAGLDFRGVNLVALVSCESERGKLIRGEGAATLGQAFLEAGAGATLSTLWRVDDAASREFMKQFYWRLARGESMSTALRNAKLAMLRSGNKLAAPAYWAALVLLSPPDGSIPRVISWHVLAGFAIFLAACLVAALRISRVVFPKAAAQ